jgi:hypothetical protein
MQVATCLSTEVAVGVFDAAVGLSPPGSSDLRRHRAANRVSA